MLATMCCFSVQCAVALHYSTPAGEELQFDISIHTQCHDTLLWAAVLMNFSHLFPLSHVDALL